MPAKPRTPIMPLSLYDLRRGIAIALCTMSILSTLTAKVTSAALRTDAGIAAVQKSALSWVAAWMRGDDINDVAGDSLTKPFAHSVWVQRAIKRVSDPITAVALDFYELTGAKGKETEITDPQLAMFWEAPGIDRSGAMDRSDFIEATIGWLKLSGEFFWLLDDTWLTKRFASDGAARQHSVFLTQPGSLRTKELGNEY